MLMPHFAGIPNLTAATCGRTHWSPDIKHYAWSFGLSLPIQRILEDHPDRSTVVALYCAIKWPHHDSDVEENIAAFKSVAAALSQEALLLSVSSLIVDTPAQSLYAKLKRRAEAICSARGGTNIRLGLIDSAKPFGQTRVFAAFARTLRVVPVPFPRANVILSTEEDVASAILRLASADNAAPQNTVEVRSAKMSFIDAIRYMVGKHGSRCICVPVPDVVTRSLLRACEHFAPGSWLCQRLQGLRGFSVM